MGGFANHVFQVGLLKRFKGGWISLCFSEAGQHLVLLAASISGINS